MTNIWSAYKCKTLFRGPYEIIWAWTNGSVTLHKGAVTYIVNIWNIKPYNDAGVE